MKVVQLGEDPIFPSSGLLPAIVQHAHTGEILMQAWCNAEAYQRTLADGKAWFYSRSRQAFWCKGETSGNTIAVHAVLMDCDADTILYMGLPAGPACHRDTRTCFTADGFQLRPFALGQLADLQDTIVARAALQGAEADGSYVSRLLAKGPQGPGAKVLEESGELVEAAYGESDERVVSEAADVLFHLMVLLESRGQNLYDVCQELRRRDGIGGLVEKASRDRADKTSNTGSTD